MGGDTEFRERDPEAADKFAEQLDQLVGSYDVLGEQLGALLPQVAR
jgi:hypothetical protein